MFIWKTESINKLKPKICIFTLQSWAPLCLCNLYCDILPLGTKLSSWEYSSKSVCIPDLFLGSTSQSRLVAQHGSFLTAPSVSKAVQASLPVNQCSIYPTSILTVTNIAQALITQFWTSAVSSCLVSQLHSPVQLT